MKTQCKNLTDKQIRKLVIDTGVEVTHFKLCNKNVEKRN